MPCLKQKVKVHFNLYYSGQKLNFKVFTYPDVVMAYGLVNKVVMQRSIEQVGEVSICPAT